MPEQGRAFGVIEGALVGLADGRASGRDDYGFGHCYLWWGCGSRFAVLGRILALLRVPHQMKGRIAKLDVDGAYALEVMADVQFVAHTHASM